jgi:hypothetical protein
MSNPIIRTMFCPTCESMQDHEIVQKGTKQKKDGVWVKFISDCKRCSDRWSMGIIKTYSIPLNVIPVKEYNALIQREIFKPANAKY